MFRRLQFSTKNKFLFVDQLFTALHKHKNSFHIAFFYFSFSQSQKNTKLFLIYFLSFGVFHVILQAIFFSFSKKVLRKVSRDFLELSLIGFCLMQEARKTFTESQNKIKFRLRSSLPCTTSDTELTDDDAEWREINFHVKSRRTLKLN
jgi:hypothetical protein